MQILFVADNFPPERNAQSARVFERAQYWRRWGHQVTVITCAPNFPEGKVFDGYKNHFYRTEELEGIRVVRVGTFIAANSGTWLRTLDHLSFMLASLIAGLFQRRPDVLVVTSPQFFAAIGAAVLGWLRGLPLVLELSDLWPDSIVAVGAMKKSLAIRLLEMIELWLYQRANHIISLTRSFKQNLVCRGVNANKITVVLNGVELSMYSPKSRDQGLAHAWGVRPRDFVVGYMGTHGMAHALQNVLAAAALSNDPDLRFVFVGAGAKRTELINQSEKMGLRNVVFIPSQPKERMPAFWSLCDVALVHLRDTPLFKTVIPSKMFEAMGMGLPVLMAVPEGEASELLVECGAGVSIPPENPHALLSAVLELKDDANRREQLAERSRASAHLHTRERQAREYLAVLMYIGSRTRHAEEPAVILSDS